MKRWQVALGIGLVLVAAWAFLSSRLQAYAFPYAGGPGTADGPGPGYGPQRGRFGGSYGFGAGGMMGGGGMMGWGGGVGAWGGKTSFSSNGEQIYYTGVSQRNGPIAFSGGPIWLPAHGGGCVSCHGPQGRGGVPVMMVNKVPANISYAHLTGPQKDGDHPPYTDELIKRAVTQGVEPNGEQLDPYMPRWRMSDQDFADLLAYLKTLGPAK